MVSWAKVASKQFKFSEIVALLFFGGFLLHVAMGPTNNYRAFTDFLYRFPTPAIDYSETSFQDFVTTCAAMDAGSREGALRQILKSDVRISRNKWPGIRLCIEGDLKWQRFIAAEDRRTMIPFRR